MTEQNWLVKAGASPAKLALVGLLSLALVAVIWHNASSRATPPLAVQTRQTTAPQKEVAKQTPQPPIAQNPQAATQVSKVWPKVALESVIKHDPFAMPMWYLMAQSAAAGSTDGSLARTAQVLEELKKQQSKIVVITDQERIAMIGELSLRVGDTIEGFQVTEITTDGIVLTELGH